MTRSTCWHGAVALLSLVLVACGGGGGGGGSDAGPGTGSPGIGPPVSPPAAATMLGNTAADAAEAVRFAVAGAESLAARHVTMSAFTALMDVPVAGSATLPLAAAPVPDHAGDATGRQVALAVRNVGCIEVIGNPCAGTAVVDTNIPDTATAILAGQYLDVRFDSVHGYVSSQPVTLNGRLRIDFLTGVNAGNTALLGLTARLTFDALSGVVAGLSYGPVSEAVDLEIGASGGVAITAGGRRYSSIGSIEVSDFGHFMIGGGTVRAEFGGRGGYADVALTGWHQSAGRPVIGSLAWVSAGDIRIAAQALAASADTITFGVNIVLSDGSPTRYTVTVTYPAGGGAPTYIAFLGG